MADIVLTKANPGFYYCYQINGGGYREWGQYEAAFVRWNDEGDAVWARSAGFTTGGYDVTNITVTVNNMSTRYKGYGNPTVGIGTAIDNIPSSNDIPNVLWSGTDTANSVVNGHNQYSMTFDVDMKAGTTYYLYLYTWGTVSTSNLGWQVLDHPNSSSDTSESTVEITFNAKTFITPKYKLTLTKDSGISQVSGSGSYEAGTYVTATATPASGYNFKNWTNSSGTAVSTSSSYSFYMPASNTVYKANSNVNVYTVSYYKGDYGVGTETTVDKAHGIALPLLGSQFTRAGYIQSGWSINADGSTLNYNLSAQYTTNQSIVLYPYWTPNIYTLTINPNGGSMYNGDLKTTNSFTTQFAYNIKTYMGNLTSSGGFYSSNEPTRMGYSCSGFAFSNGSGQKNASGYKFYFNGGYPGSGGAGSNTNTWIFNGDYAGNVTATAQWVNNTYTVKYNANGGSGTMANSIHTYDIANPLSTNTFTRTGYSFIGWNTAADGSGTSYSDKQSVSTLIASGEIELFAQWGQATYKVIFDANGGSFISGNFDPVNYTVGSTYTLPTGTIQRQSYIFLGWSKSSTATSASYSDGASVTALTTAGNTVTLYAVWRAKTFTIKYNANNGNTTSSSIPYTATNSNAFSTLPSNWTKSGYSASGWSTSNTATIASYAFGQAFNDLEEIVDGGTLNLYVVWTKNTPWKLTLIKAKFGGVEYTF